MINLPESEMSSPIRCSICKSTIQDRHRLYQSNSKIGIICKSCKSQFSEEDIEMMVNIFFIYGGYFGQFEKTHFSIDETILKFAEELGVNKADFSVENVKMWHKVLTHGITPKKFLKNLSLLAGTPIEIEEKKF